ncbi:hypothetical protein [Paraflavitalea pollutisoli]|uniref:hypothetical protein n=1 Tax=Paraflavitalea pollutisoli TaxID=3034143 RepID=UPI0023EAB62E|nr:hypothetical protein [Paraflavitalea sp. H1-2-19X]
MKKLLAPLLFLVAQSTIAQSGQLRILFYGIHCQQPTTDNPLGMDGVGDEVFVMSYAAVTKPNYVAPTLNINGGCQVYGEVERSLKGKCGWQREKAGTAGVLGGFKSGDVYTQTANRQIILVDKKMAADEVAFVMPSVWEFDIEQGNYPSGEFGRVSEQEGKSVFFQQKIVNYYTNISYNPDHYGFLIAGRHLDLDTKYAPIFKPFVGQPVSRPIGMTAGHEFSSVVLAINTRMAALLVNKDFGYGVGVVPVLFNDVTLGNTANKGIYSMLFKIEFKPDAVAPSSTPVAPPPAARANTTPVVPTNVNPANAPVNMNIRKNATTTSVNITGSWAGSWDNASRTGSYVMRFNKDGSMQWLDVRGNVLGSGQYTVSGYEITGNCQLTHGESIPFRGTLSGADRISGKWGSTKSTGGEKNWELVKQP